MAAHERFRLTTLQSLKEKMKELNLSFPISEDTSVMFDRVAIGNCTAPNRFIVHPMEGFDAAIDGTPGPLAFRRYRRYAEGGSGLIWFEATAVRPEARTNPGQFMLTRDNVATFKHLVAQVRELAAKNFGPNHRPVCILQITHSGRYSKMLKPLVAHHSPILDPPLNLAPDYPLLTDEDIEGYKQDFLLTAQLAKEAGFDGVDVKSCHRYLISELLASFTRENSRFGGSFENRTRFLRETAALISENVKGLFATCRLNLFDAIEYPYGWGVSTEDKNISDLTEPLKLIGMLAQAGFPTLNTTIGNPYFNPQFNRPFDFPIAGAKEPENHPLEGVARFLKITAEVQKAYPKLPVIGSGYSWLRHLLPYVAAGVVREGWATLIGQGRGAFAYPDSVKDLMKNGTMEPRKACVACSGCTQLMRDVSQTGCVIRDSEVYGKKYREARKRALDYLKKEAERCRDCAYPNCQTGCPAGVDVPGFIKAFANNDIKTAYEILKKNNVLPELCAYVCPSNVQCEHACMETIMAGRAVPIRDIQLLVSKQARAMGLVSAVLPEKDNGKKMAIIGAGPAGIACAVKLLEAGYQVDLYDKDTQPGGTPLNAIPAYRLTVEDTLSEAFAVLKPAIDTCRLAIVPGFVLSAAKTIDALKEKGYKAIFLSIGLSASQTLPGAQKVTGGVVDAIEFLKDAKQGVTTKVPDRVAIIGGGNTAMDAALTAKRLGAHDVYLVYRRSFAEMPAWPTERDEVLAAGVHFLTLTAPGDYVTEKGALTALEVARRVLGEPDTSNRRRPVVVPNSESLLPVDLVIEAIGQVVSADVHAALPGVEFDKSGLIKVNERLMTTRPGVFAGGDIVNGGTTAVQAVAEGMKAALEMEKYCLAFTV